MEEQGLERTASSKLTSIYIGDCERKMLIVFLIISSIPRFLYEGSPCFAEERERTKQGLKIKKYILSFFDRSSKGYR